MVLPRLCWYNTDNFVTCSGMKLSLNFYRLRTPLIADKLFVCLALAEVHTHIFSCKIIKKKSMFLKHYSIFPINKHEKEKQINKKHFATTHQQPRYGRNVSAFTIEK